MADEETPAGPDLNHGPNPALYAQPGVDAARAAEVPAEAPAEEDKPPADKPKAATRKAGDDDDEPAAKHKSAGGKAGGRA